MTIRLSELTKIDNVDRTTARRIRAIAETSASPEAALEQVNTLLNLHGVEYAQTHNDRCSRLYGLLYVNNGDSYKTTLIFDYRTDTYKTAAVGCMIERYPNRYI